MHITTAILMLCMAGALGAAVIVYERMLARVRAERDEALADADLATDLFTAAIQRHPAQGNVRVLRSVK